MYLLLWEIGKEWGCIRDEGNEEEEIRNCVQDCPNPRATECYDYYVENGVWMEGCEEVMTDCGCYDFGTELDCYKQALNYIRKHLTFEPNNACAVLAYVQDNFKCYTPEIVRPETPYPFPDLNLPGVDDDGNNTLPDRDEPYQEEERKPIWWYHTDHLGSSTYLTDNFGRPSHYYETLPFGEMMVEHNQSANVPSGVGYDNKFKFNGKELDDATQMYYYGARYYDPRISIFVSVDPLAQKTMTPYQYVNNNPIMFTDPTGMEGEIIDPKNEESRLAYEEYKSIASPEKKAELKVLEDSPIIYNIDVKDEFYGGATKYNTNNGEIDIEVQNVGDYTVGILADELTHAYQYQTGEIGYDRESGAIVNYDLQDEIDSKMATISVLERKGLKMENIPGLEGTISAEYGRMHTANGGVLSNDQISKWTKIKNPVEDTSYRDLFFNSNGSWKPGVRTQPKDSKKNSTGKRP